MAEPGGVVDPIAVVGDDADVPPGPLVIALSGGADSAVCAWAALQHESSVRAIFVDHGFAESSKLGEAARAIAAELGIDLDIVAVVVPSGASPEGQARMVRHAALEEGLKSSETLLSGHTADDNAETVLGNVLRGAGGSGLSGIPARRGRWARPLLGIDRATVRAAADALGLPYADDPANLDSAPRRNQLRHEVMPVLRDRFNPELNAALVRTARLSRDDDATLEAEAAKVPLTTTAAGVKIPAAALATAPAAVASRVARRAIRVARGPYGGEAVEVDAVLAAINGTATTIGAGLQAAREGPWVVLARPLAPPPAPVTISAPGITTFWAGTITAVHGAPAWRPIGRSLAVVEAGPLEIRVAAPGERIAIEGGHKRVTTVLAEAGVPERLRGHWPVVARRGSIAWVVGVRPAVASGHDRVTLTARLEEQ